MSNRQVRASSPASLFRIRVSNTFRQRKGALVMIYRPRQFQSSKVQKANLNNKLFNISPPTYAVGIIKVAFLLSPSKLWKKTITTNSKRLELMSKMLKLGQNSMQSTPDFKLKAIIKTKRFSQVARVAVQACRPFSSV